VEATFSAMEKSPKPKAQVGLAQGNAPGGGLYGRNDEGVTMSIETVQFTEMVRQAHADLVVNLVARFCQVCECETEQVQEAHGCRCIECGYVEVSR
jgi:hypothetical protein